MGLAKLVQSSGWKNFMAKLYGLGASVVIVGALFKIQHWQGAGVMLTLGLLTEAIIFFFSAFEPLHEEVDWSLVYPELAGISDDDIVESGAHSYGGDKGRGGYSGGGGYGGGAGSVALAKFDEMLENAEISPDLFQKLGGGMKKLSETAANINIMSDVNTASVKYASAISSANDSLDRKSVV